MAGLIPLLSQIALSNQTLKISPAWASVALVVAVALVGLDKFFGFSSAWIRFLTAEMQIRNTLQAFQIDWEIKKATLKGADPSDDQVQDMLAQCKTFLTQVNAILVNEMTAWKLEFQTALKQIDDAAKAQTVVGKLGGANVIIKNGDKCENGWDLSIDEGISKHFAGKSAGLSNLSPGIHTIRVKGKVEDKVVQSVNAVTIPPGSTAMIELELF